jgi:hypothetical protein
MGALKCCCGYATMSWCWAVQVKDSCVALFPVDSLGLFELPYGLMQVLHG